MGLNLNHLYDPHSNNHVTKLNRQLSFQPIWNKYNFLHKTYDVEHLLSRQ